MKVGGRVYCVPSQVSSAMLRELYDRSKSHAAVAAEIAKHDVLPRYLKATSAPAPTPSAARNGGSSMLALLPTSQSLQATLSPAPSSPSLLGGVTDALKSITSTVADVVGTAVQTTQAVSAVRAALKGGATGGVVAPAVSYAQPYGPGMPVGASGPGAALELYGELYGAATDAGMPAWAGASPLTLALYGAGLGRGKGSILPSAGGTLPGDAPAASREIFGRVVAPGIIRPSRPIPRGLRVSVVDRDGRAAGWLMADVAIPARSVVVYEAGADGRNDAQMMALMGSGLQVGGYTRVDMGGGISAAIILRGRKRRRLHGTDRAIRDFERCRKKVARAKKIVNKLIPKGR